MSFLATRAARRAAWMGRNRVANAVPGQTAAGAPGRVGGVEIGSLVLRGFDRRTGSRVAAAFERQMGELLRAGALPEGWRVGGRAGEMRGERVRVRSLNDPAGIGERLAISVFEARLAESAGAGGRR